MPLGGGIAAGVGAIGSGFLGGKGAKSAAETQSAAADRASQLQMQMYNQQRTDQNPWRQAGVQALYGNGGIFRRANGASGPSTNEDQIKNSWIDTYVTNAQQARNEAGGGESDDQIRARVLADWNANGRQDSLDKGLIHNNAENYEIDPELTRNFTMADFQKDPGYDFRMQEGQKALERSAAASGGLMSGNFAKELAKYGQDYASNEYGNAYNRFNNDQTNRFNRLSSISGFGQNANAQIGQAGQNYANQVGQNMMGAANAQGAAQIAGANAWGNTIKNLGNIGMSTAAMADQKNWMQQNLSGLGTNSPVGSVSGYNYGQSPSSFWGVS